MKKWLKINNKLLLEPDISVLNECGILSWCKSRAFFTTVSPLLSFKGFYMVELSIKNISASMDSTFFVNQDSKHPMTFNLPIKESGCFKRLCYFSEKVESIQWSPGEQSGSLESVDLVLKKVTKGFAKSRMLKKLKLKQYNGDMKGLLSAYDQCFAFSKNAVISNEHRDVLGEEKVFFLSANGKECLMKASSDVSEQERSWLESKKASTFTRTSSGLIKRLDK